MAATETGIDLDSFTFRPDSGTYLARYDRSETSPSMAIVAAVSEALSVDPTEMEQLYYAVDTSSLDDLLRGCDAVDGDVRVAFEFAGREVTVTRNEVTVAAGESDAESRRELLAGSGGSLDSNSDDPAGDFDGLGAV